MSTYTQNQLKELQGCILLDSSGQEIIILSFDSDAVQLKIAEIEKISVSLHLFAECSKKYLMYVNDSSDELVSIEAFLSLHQIH